MHQIVCTGCGESNPEFNPRCKACGSALPLETQEAARPGAASGGAGERLEGRRLAHYSIVSVLGQGGMGTVYAAQDTRLGRTVALKVLPAAKAAEPERLERFRREARAVAMLNHPNIVTVHSIEEADGLHFMALELVRGKTLASLIPPNGLALERWLELALPLAGALGAAHKERILHRDLKPSNVMLSDAGQVKVLDFGLAKLWEEATAPPEEAVGGAEAAEAPIEAPLASKSSLTSTGRLLGTAPYMPPELLRGQPLDPRSDLYSLGVVLYEMAAGSRPFQQATQGGLMEAILEGKFPPLAQRRPDLPERLARLVERCMAVDPARRYPSADELREELEGLRREVARAARMRIVRPVAAVLAGAALLAAGFGGQSLWRSWHRFELTFHDSIALVTWPSNDRGARLSPDGRQISFLSDRGGEDEVWLTDPEGRQTRKLPAAGLHVLGSAWSPDGREIACVGLDKESGGAGLEIVPVAGGPARTLDGAQLLRSGHRLIRWIGDRLYLYGSDGLWRYDLKAGSAEVLFRCAPKEKILGIDVLADESAMIASLYRNGQENLWLGAIDGQGLRQLTHDSAAKREPRWIDASGRWAMYLKVEGSTSNLRAISTATGEERELLSETEACVPEDVGGGGSVVLRTCTTQSSHVYTAQDGSDEVQRTADALEDFLPSVALQRRTLAFQRAPRQGGFWNVATGALSTLVGSLDSDRFDDGSTPLARALLPRLSPDGQWLAFLRHDRSAEPAESRGLWDLHVVGMQAARSGDLVSAQHTLFEMNELPPTYFYAENLAWSHDSSRLYHAAEVAPHSFEIRRLEPATGGATPIVRVDRAEQVYRLALAPDDRRLAFGLVLEGSALGAGRRWELRLWDGSGPQGSTISTEPLPVGTSEPLLLGWAGPQSLLLLRQQPANPEEVATELREIDLTGASRTLLSVPDAHHPGLAAWDPATRRVYMDRRQKGVVNLYRLAVDTGRWQAMTRNRVPGVTYSGICPLGDEGVLFVR